MEKKTSYVGELLDKIPTTIDVGIYNAAKRGKDHIIFEWQEPENFGEVAAAISKVVEAGNGGKKAKYLGVRREGDRLLLSPEAVKLYDEQWNKVRRQKKP